MNAWTPASMLHTLLEGERERKSRLGSLKCCFEGREGWVVGIALKTASRTVPVHNRYVNSSDRSSPVSTTFG